MADKIHEVICEKCGHSTSGPDKKAVEEVAERHVEKTGHKPKAAK